MNMKSDPKIRNNCRMIDRLPSRLEYNWKINLFQYENVQNAPLCFYSAYNSHFSFETILRHANSFDSEKKTIEKLA